MVPPATQIADSAGAIWTVAANQAILRNGAQAAGGWGSKILWTNATIYVLGNDRNWWRWSGAGWINVGASQPGGTSTSPDGTMVPPATQIADSAGAIWTVAANQAVLRDGTQAAGGWGSKILWTNATIYVLGTDRNWWRWTGAGWINVGAIQPGGTSTSPDGAMAPPATQIVDSVGAIWTVAANQTILRNGVQAADGIGSKLLWRNSTIYVLGTDDNWWRWNGTGWVLLGPSQP
jgi:hypothetical protein